jgi:hypothetical protein
VARDLTVISKNMPTLHWAGKDKVVNRQRDAPSQLLDKVYAGAAFL